MVWQFLMKPRIYFSNNSVIVLLNTIIFTEFLFIIAPTESKQFVYQYENNSTGLGIDIKYYSVIKKNKLLEQETIWVNLEIHPYKIHQNHYDKMKEQRPSTVFITKSSYRSF